MNLEAVEQGVTIIHACASPQDKKLSTLASLPTPLTSPTPVLELDVRDRQHKKSAHDRLSWNARHLRHYLIVLVHSQRRSPRFADHKCENVLGAEDLVGFQITSAAAETI